VKIFTNK